MVGINCICPFIYSNKPKTISFKANIFLTKIYGVSNTNWCPQIVVVSMQAKLSY